MQAVRDARRAPKMEAPSQGEERPAFWETAPELLAVVNEATAELSTSDTVSDTVLGAVRRLVNEVALLSPENFLGADPYLVEALLTGTVACANVGWLGLGDASRQRGQLRIQLERARQALRDLLAERSVVADRPVKEVLRWLVSVTEVPQHELASVLGAGSRTFQRWLSCSEPAAPSGDDEMRVRTLARVIDQLRWSMTSAGVMLWLQRPHPSLQNKKPADLLSEPGAYSELARLAATTRAMVGA